MSRLEVGEKFRRGNLKSQRGQLVEAGLVGAVSFESELDE